jgi:putative ABC transport system permease protein
VPALRAAQAAPNEAIRQNGGANAQATDRKRRLKFGGGLVVMEVALAFVLLAGSLLMTHTLRNALRQSPGFRTDHLLTLDLPGRDIGSEGDEAQRRRNMQRAKAILERVESVPGVERAALIDHPLLEGMMSMTANLTVEGAVPVRSGEERTAYSHLVSPGYFRMMQVPLLRGREFTERDSSEGALLAILVNETMARQYWNTLDVIGKRISTSLDDNKQPQWSEVIGVVKDTRDVMIVDEPVPEYFQPILRGQTGTYHLLVRTRMQPEALGKTISREIWAQFPNQPVTRIVTMTQSIAESLGDRRMNAVLLDAFAGIGLLLALVGVYGVIAFSVARRTQEVGIRLAVGAQRRDILLMIGRQGMLPVALGTSIGVAGALAIGRLLAGQLYGVKASDPPTLVGAVLVLAVVAALACYLPAKRAMRVDPVVALRYE